MDQTTLEEHQGKLVSKTASDKRNDIQIISQIGQLMEMVINMV
jgi:hypothetical protein